MGWMGVLHSWEKNSQDGGRSAGPMRASLQWVRRSGLCCSYVISFSFSCVQLLGCYATLLILGATSCCLHGFFFPLSLLMGFPRSHCDMGFFEVCVYANDT